MAALVFSCVYGFGIAPKLSNIVEWVSIGDACERNCPASDAAHNRTVKVIRGYARANADRIMERSAGDSLDQAESFSARAAARTLNHTK